MRNRLPDDVRARALEALRRSAEQHDGEPRWNTVAKEVGVSRPALKAIWAEAHEEGRPRTRPDRSNLVAFPGGSEAPPTTTGPVDFDPIAAGAVEYWTWKWRELQIRKPTILSDIAAIQAMKYEDEVWAQLRAAVDARRKQHGVTPAEIEQQLRDLAQRMAPDHADTILKVFRARKLIA